MGAGTGWDDEQEWGMTINVYEVSSGDVENSIKL